MNTISLSPQINTLFALSSTPAPVTPQIPVPLDTVVLAGNTPPSRASEAVKDALFLGAALGVPSALGASLGLPGVVLGCAVDTAAAAYMGRTMDKGAKRAAITAAAIVGAAAGGIGAVFGWPGVALVVAAGAAFGAVHQR